MLSIVSASNILVTAGRLKISMYVCIHMSCMTDLLNVSGNGGGPEREESGGRAFLGPMVEPVSRFCRRPGFVLQGLSQMEQKQFRGK